MDAILRAWTWTQECHLITDHLTCCLAYSEFFFTYMEGLLVGIFCLYNDINYDVISSFYEILWSFLSYVTSEEKLKNEYDIILSEIFFFYIHDSSTSNCPLSSGQSIAQADYKILGWPKSSHYYFPEDVMGKHEPTFWPTQ